jgi:hypothetical protein
MSDLLLVGKDTGHQSRMVMRFISVKLYLAGTTEKEACAKAGSSPRFKIDISLLETTG